MRNFLEQALDKVAEADEKAYREAWKKAQIRIANHKPSKEVEDAFRIINSEAKAPRAKRWGN